MILEMQVVFSGGAVCDCVETAHELSIKYNATVSFKCNGISWTIRPKDNVDDFLRQYDTGRGLKQIGEPAIFLKRELC